MTRWVALGVALAFCLGEKGEASIQHVADGFLFTGTSSSLLISDTNGSILSMGTGGDSVATGGDSGLWTATEQNGGATSQVIKAADFSSATNSFQWALAPAGNQLLLTYDNAQITVVVTITDQNDGVDLSARVCPKAGTVQGISLPAQLRFNPQDMQRLIAPSHSSDGVGMAFNPTYFQSQTEETAASWNQSVVGPAPYISLYGADCLYQSYSPPVPINFTTSGTAWLGNGVVNQYASATANVHRPPAAGQADVILIDSPNGAFFSGSHLNGGANAGWLLRIGGGIDPTRIPLALDVVVGAIEHLAQTPGSRTKVGLLSMVRGPMIGYNWPSAVPIPSWADRLSNSSVLASQNLEFVQLSTVQEMMNAMSSGEFLAIVNPYGELIPASLGGGVSESVAEVGNFVRAGGNWFEVGGHAFYQALQPELYYSNQLAYPPAFADFLQLETVNGNVAIYGIQPPPLDPWSTDPACLFVPGQLAWGGDNQGGYCERSFATYVGANQSWQSPVVRVSLGHSAQESLQAYSQANGLTRALPEKMPADVLAKFKESVLIYYYGDDAQSGDYCAQMISHLPQLPSPALIHFAQYLWGGFDKLYPDHLNPSGLTPNSSFGSAAEFSSFLSQARQLGHLTMPYTNPTFWSDNPRGPTFLAKGEAPLLRNLDGTLSFEDYFGNGGYTACPWHPDVQAANQNTRQQFTGTYPVDLLFEDQIGARTWQYDTNSTSPTPYAYMAGNGARAAEDSLAIPVSTENGYDRLVNFESQFCGLAWGLVPTPNAPDWRRFLRDRYAPSTWTIFPLAQQLAHDKLAMNFNDLNASVANDEVVAWCLGLGYGTSYRLKAADLDQEQTRQWLLWVDRLQKAVCARYIGQPVNSFSHRWGTDPVNPDNGVIQASYGPVNVVANLGPQTLALSGTSLPAFGFIASAPGLLAAKGLPPNSPAPVYSVAQTGSDGTLDFWIYSKPGQSMDLALPAGFNGPATVELDNCPAVQTQIQASALTVSLGAALSATTCYLWHGKMTPFGYATNSDNTVTITGYGGPGGALSIPSALAGLRVSRVGNYAFNSNTALTSVAIPDSVTSIGSYAFYNCSGLTSLTLGAGLARIEDAAFQGCTGLSNLTIPDSVATLGNFAFYGCSGLASVSLGRGCNTLGQGAFQACSGLRNLTIPTNVTNLGIWAFSFCDSLTSVVFLGNAPAIDSSVFANDNRLSVYYLPGTAGWTNPWNSHPAILWNPQANNLRTEGGQFTFDISGPTNLELVVESCADLGKPVWAPLGTINIINGSATFSDPASSSARSRFYRFRAP